ncbi:hypothetical protein EV401DRAFT_2072774 [Pisolithus croceorrhizus]|nr:hypothetical protein EV401DRAFT_2072774 [Pisolithus croceorrhizus]
MAPGCFILAPAGTTQPSDEGVRDAPVIEITRPHSLPSPDNTDVLVPASTQDSLLGSTGALTPALTEVQLAGPHSPEGNVNIPGLAHAEEISSGEYFTYDERDKSNGINNQHHPCQTLPFAGILRKLKSTSIAPLVFAFFSWVEQMQVDATVVQGSLTRGLHNIEDELVFRGNPRFVSHDSRGFEAGSEDQFNSMTKFVIDRAKTIKLNERIHAIWFCIP